MAKGDIRIFDVGGHINVPVRTFPTPAGGTSIKAGEPVRINTVATYGRVNAYVIPLADADGIHGQYFVGIAANTSSETSSASGNVDVYLDMPGIIYAAKPKTLSTWDTQAEVDAAIFYRVIIDLTSSAFTVDVTNDFATNNASFMIMGGDPATYTVYFAALDGGSWRSAGQGTG